jgi:hypothetical protein
LKEGIANFGIAGIKSLFGVKKIGAGLPAQPQRYSFTAFQFRNSKSRNLAIPLRGISNFELRDCGIERRGLRISELLELKACLELKRLGLAFRRSPNVIPLRGISNFELRDCGIEGGDCEFRNCWN